MCAEGGSGELRRVRLAAVIGVLFIIASLLVAGCGGGSVSVPNVKRLSLVEARRVLSDSGLKAQVSSEILDDQVPKGYVVEQKPRAGETVDAETVVALAISAGSSGVTVPSVLGKDAVQATTELNQLGLQVRLIRVTSSEPSGTVLNQSPGAGATATPDSKVDLTVAVNYDRSEPTGTPLPSLGTTSRSSGAVVVIDPGHQARGNRDQEPVGPGSSETKDKVASGATGAVTGKPEYVVTLQISMKLRSYLQSRGIKVVMTRLTHDVDVSNVERAQIANRAGAALFVRVHADSSRNASDSGIRTWYPPNKDWTTPIYAKSSLAATIVQERAAARSHLKNLGTQVHDNQTGFNWSKVPVILVECGFLSNAVEDRMLNNPASQEAIAKGIGEGIVEYLRRVR